LQRAITRQVEQVQRDALHADFDALPRGDVRRLAWFSVGVGSSQWVTAHPNHDVLTSLRSLDVELRKIENELANYWRKSVEK